MRFLYSSFIFLLGFGIRMAAILGNDKAKSWVKGRSNWLQRLQAFIPKDREVIWFHCASLGEFEQARPLLEMIKKDQDHFILLSFFSPSGYESKKNYDQADHICYLPLDSRKNAKAFIKCCQPKLSFFAKYEFWFNLLFELRKEKRAHFLISGIFRPKQQFFRFYGKWFRDHLAAFDHLYLQDEASKKLLNSFEIHHCSVSGDGRFDRVWEIAQQPAELPLIERFCRKQTTIVFGSSWDKENQLAFQLIRDHSNIKIVIAPHEYDQSEFENLEKKYRQKVDYYSKLNGEDTSSSILVIDTVGLLSKIYRFGDIAVIGGGFGKGIHNILEAAVYGLPVLFGPNFKFFNEAWELLSKGGAKVFKNEKQFHRQIQELINRQEQRRVMAEISREYLQQRIGSTRLIYSNLKQQSYL